MAHLAAGALLLTAAFAAAPPAAAETDIEQVVVAGEYRYARGRRSGVHVSFDQGHTWQARGEGLPRRITYPFPEPPEFAAVTHLAADPSDPRRLAATTATGLYLTTDGGVSWREIPVRQVPFNTYFTSVALSPHDPAGMLLGTSFHGVFESADGGATWWHLRSVLGFLLEQSLFYEEVAGLSYDPSAPRAMTVLAGFDGGVYHVADRLATGSGRSSSPVRRYPAPAAGTIQLAYAPVDDGWELQAGTVDARWRLTASGAWSPVDAKAQELHGAPPLPLAPQPVPAQPAELASEASQPPSDAESPQPAAPDPDSPQASAEASDSPNAAAPPDAPAIAQPAADSQPSAPRDEPAVPADASESAPPTADRQPPPETPDAPVGASESAQSPPATVDPQPPAPPPDAPQAPASAAESPKPAEPPDTPQAAADPQPPAAPAEAPPAGAAESVPPPQPAADRQPSPGPSEAPPSPATAADVRQPAQAASDPQSPATATGAAQPAAGTSEQSQPVEPASAPHKSPILAGLPQVPPPGSGPQRPPTTPATAPAQTPPDSGLTEPPAPETTPAEPAPDTARSQASAGDPADPDASDATAPDTGQPSPSETASPAPAGAEPPAAAEPPLLPAPPPLPAAATRSAPRPQAALRNGIYLSTYRAAAALPEYLEFLNRHGLDSVVIDFKDDRGKLSYDSNLALAHAIGAAPGPIELDRLIEQAHGAGIYVIARLVVFKDRYLYDWQDHRLAIWDAELGAPWRHLVAGDDPEIRVQREYWVDPFAPEVWEYNVAVAAELAARGVDEIQFDYIRFPSDGPVERSLHRHRRPGMGRIDAIESFLALARERLQVPISTDLFGFNSWYRAGNWLGQDIAVLSEYADVISPMFYPSHFPDHFLDDRSYAERAYAIYEAGVRRAQRMVQGRSYVRPYVQAFLIGKELRMEEEEFSDYLTRQLDGNRAAAGSGFTLWNASNRYYMVTEPLQPYFDARGEEMP